MYASHTAWEIKHSSTDKTFYFFSTEYVSLPHPPSGNHNEIC